MSKYKSVTSEYMKIRRYIMNMALRAGGRSVQIPSIHALSDQFGVSCPTVCKALKELTNDGHLISKQGIGSFTNPTPHIYVPGDEKKRLIGLLTSDGMISHYDSYMTSLMGELMRQATRRLGWIHLFNLSGHRKERVLRDIRDEQLSGLLWLCPPKELEPAMEALRDEGLPLVACDGKRGAPNNVRIDYEGVGREIGARLLAEGRRRIVYMVAKGSWAHMLQGLLEAYNAAGVELDKKLFLSRPECCFADLENLLKRGTPIDAVCCSIGDGLVLTEMLQRHGLDLQHQCRMVQARDIEASDDGFQGLSYSCDSVGFGRLAVDVLESLMAGQSVDPFPSSPVTLREVNLHSQGAVPCIRTSAAPVCLASSR